MKLATHLLIGAPLDWAVAAALNSVHKEDRVIKVCRNDATSPAWIERENSLGSAPYFHRFSPSTDGSQGIIIIEQEKIEIRWFPPECNRLGYWWTQNILTDTYGYTGPTPLIAAMRCFVGSELGNEIEFKREL